METQLNFAAPNGTSLQEIPIGSMIVVLFIGLSGSIHQTPSQNRNERNGRHEGGEEMTARLSVFGRNRKSKT